MYRSKPRAIPRTALLLDTLVRPGLAQAASLLPPPPRATTRNCPYNGTKTLQWLMHRPLGEALRRGKACAQSPEAKACSRAARGRCLPRSGEDVLPPPATTHPAMRQHPHIVKVLLPLLARESLARHGSISDSLQRQIAVESSHQHTRRASSRG